MSSLFVVADLFFCLLYSFVVSFLVLNINSLCSLVETLYHVDRQKIFMLVKPNASFGLVVRVSKPT